MERRAKLSELDLVRAIAIFGVIMVHSVSFATLDMKETSIYGLYNFLNIFFKIGTTTFIMLSSFVLFYNYYPQPLTVQRFAKFYRKRFAYIVIPYILFSALYFVIRWYENDKAWDLSAMFPQLWDEILHGKAYTHLYFVFINIQLYLLFPILLFLLQRAKWLAAVSFLLGVALQWAFFHYNREYWQVANRGSWSPSYFGQYFLGAWLGIYFDRIKSWLIISKANAKLSRIIAWVILWGTWIAFGASYVTIWYNARLHGTRYSQLTYDLLWDGYTMLMPLILMQVAFLLGSRMNSSFLVGRMRHLGVVSFGVYLFHPLVLMVYRKFPVEGGGTMIHHLWYAGGFVCALGISWVVVTVISRLTNWSWLIFGNVPGQLQATYGDKEKAKQPAAPSASA
ncbi:acyltransferase [Cohnella yongneupensis]|uniref:Acyltransferase n=1 Tax=Cohnella yongneupensis TaxID=425006 RepID=A0ABW0R182_9BACL